MYPKTTETREIHCLDGIWQVYYVMDENVMPDDLATHIPENVEDAAVPASLNEQVTGRVKYLHMGDVWYYRHFRVPASWKDAQITLRFGAVNYRCEVYVDGQSLISHETGYTPFEVTLPESCKPGQECLLAVRVDNKLSSETVPQGNVPPHVGGVAGWRVGNLPDVHYDFFPYTGIHRSVQLINYPKQHLNYTRWTTKSIETGSCIVATEYEWSGQVDRIQISIPELNFSQDIQADSSGKLTHDIELSDVTPWSCETPELYEIDIRLFEGEQCVDHYPLTFGFRIVEIKGYEILLNGKPIEMRGFGRHEDLNVIGKGLCLPYIVKDYNLMEWVGANSFRTTHYPYSEEQLQMADKRGFLVIDETAANTLSMHAVNDDPAMKKRLLELHKTHIQEVIHRDYNHPCVIAWSLGNECEMMNHQSQGYMTDVVRYAKTLDQSRPISMVSVTVDDIPEIDAKEFDFIAANVYPAWYWAQGRLERIKPWLHGYVSELAKTYGKPILISEFGADAIAGQHHEHSLMWTEEYQVKMVAEILSVAEEHPACFGAHVWNFADYLVGQHTARVVLNWKGVFTRERKPKMAAHMLRERWLGKKVSDIDECIGDEEIKASQLRYT